MRPSQIPPDPPDVQATGPDRAPSARGPTVILITGASTGLGLALVRLLIPHLEYHLILCAREGSLARFERAGIFATDRIWLRALDVGRTADRHQVVAEADERLGGVDILVNNAGLAYRSVLEHVSEGDWLEPMRVNFHGPAELARLVLPRMRAKRRGRIISLSSVGGMMAMPTMALYSASKFALEGAFEALWYEVRPWGIYVTLVQPGFVRSDSFRNTRFTALAVSGWHQDSDPYHKHYRHMDRFITRWMHSALATPENVARTVLRVMRQRHPPLRVPATPDAYLFGCLRRFVPRRMYHWMLYRLLPGVHGWGDRGSEAAPNLATPAPLAGPTADSLPDP